MPGLYKLIRIKRFHRSMISQIFSVFLMLVVINAVCFLVLYLTDSRQVMLGENLVKKNEPVSRIYITLDTMDTLLGTYIRTANRNILIRYMSACTELGNLLEEVHTSSADRQQILNSIRRLTSFNDYQKKLLFTENISSNYLDYVFIKRCIESQKTEAQSLVFENLRETAIDYKISLQHMEKTKTLLWLIIISTVAASSLFLGHILKYIKVTLSAVEKNTEQLSRKNWNVADIGTCQYRELDRLSAAINSLKHEIIRYMNAIKDQMKLELRLHEEKLENERKDKLIAEERIQILKSQINPHFLFNTLNIIGKTAVLDNPEKTMEMIEAISKILRYSIQTDYSNVTLGEELKIVQLYIYLQQARFGSKINFRLNVSNDILPMFIPPMIIQPIIENSIKFSLNTKKSVFISIDIYKKKDFLNLRIRDDGPGFQNADMTAVSSSSIGLKNVISRLELEYKRNDLFDIKSKSGKGTTVTIRIPSGR